MIPVTPTPTDSHLQAGSGSRKNPAIPPITSASPTFFIGRAILPSDSGSSEDAVTISSNVARKDAEDPGHRPVQRRRDRRHAMGRPGGPLGPLFHRPLGPRRSAVL